MKEFCYNVKYVARNGRPGRNPWSIRQVGIYERLNVKTGQSVWIVIQPSDQVRKQMGWGLETKSERISNVGTKEELGAQTMTVHASVLIAAGREWGLYIEELRFQVKEMVYLHIPLPLLSISTSERLRGVCAITSRLTYGFDCRTKMLSTRP